MSKKLTAPQIQQLYEFCKEQGVEYYDVQIELVDHLAEAIEQAWVENENQTFSEIMKKQSACFSSDDLQRIVMKKRKSLRQKYFNLISSLVGEYFISPKFFVLLLVFLFVLGSFKLMILYPYFEVFMLMVYGVVHYILFELLARRTFSLKHESGKLFLVEKQLRRFSPIVKYFGAIPVYLFLIDIVVWDGLFAALSIFQVTILSAFVSVYYLLLYVVYFVFPHMVQKEFEEQYPQFVKS